MSKAQFLLVVEYFVSSIDNAVKELRKQPEFANLEVLLITKNPQRYEKSEVLKASQILLCDFSDKETDSTITQGNSICIK